MMSENDFYQINGNGYRGSRYANFVGSGTDAQGNVSSASVENNSNNRSSTPSQQTPQLSSDVLEVSEKGVSPGLANTKPTIAPTIGTQAKNAAIGGVTTGAASTIGGVVGANVASGAPAFSNLAQGIGERVSSGLLGSGASSLATNQALSNLGSGVYGPATSSGLANTAASKGAGIGGAAGSGIGTAAGVLLSGGSVKDAAFQGTGAAIGAYVGSAFPVVGTFIGSFVGSTIGKFIGGAFGGGTPRVTLGTIIGPQEDGKIGGAQLSNKGANNEASGRFSDQITGILNTFSDAIGAKYTKSYNVGTNVGKKDTGTTYQTAGGPTVKVSDKAGDAGGFALSVLRDRGAYTLNNPDDKGFSDFWDKALAEASDINDLGTKVDNYFSGRNVASAPVAGAQNSIARRQGDKYATFYS